MLLVRCHILGLCGHFPDMESPVGWGNTFRPFTAKRSPGKNWSTASLQVRRGVLQGDTLSPLLFLMVMQVGLHGLENSCPQGGFQTKNGGDRQFLKCFADDLTIMGTTGKKLQNTVTKLERIMEWLGMEIKPSKCRVFGLAKGKYRKVEIDVCGQRILDVETMLQNSSVWNSRTKRSRKRAASLRKVF